MPGSLYLPTPYFNQRTHAVIDIKNSCKKSDFRLIFLKFILLLTDSWHLTRVQVKHNLHTRESQFKDQSLGSTFRINQPQLNNKFHCPWNSTYSVLPFHIQSALSSIQQNLNEFTLKQENGKKILSRKKVGIVLHEKV